MLDIRILLAALWVVVMFIYVLGDILRIYSGDIARLSGQPDSGAKWLMAAVLMLIPIMMIFLSLVLPQPINRAANMLVAGGFFVFVLVDIRSYPSAYDKFLLAVSMGFKVATIWCAWQWV
jgi:hypothetical protein